VPPSPPPAVWWAQLTSEYGGGDGAYDLALDYRWYEITASSVLLMLATLVLTSGGFPFLQARSP